MKRKLITILTITVGAIALIACLDDISVQDPVPTVPITDDNCEANGGYLMTGPMSQMTTCVLPTKDAGKSCVSSADCSTHCLADTMTCAPEKPYYGCFDEAIAPGRTATLCME